MTIAELVTALSEFDPFTEVRLATERDWPFESSIRGVVDGNKLGGPHTGDTRGKAYIVEGEPLGFFTKDVWDIV
jgi:hypothetical protein